MRHSSPRHGLRHVRPLEDRVVPAVLDFTLVQAQSSLTMTGNIAGAPFASQGSGSLVSSYTGAIRAEIDLTANTINFVSAPALIDGTVSGIWQPAIGGGAGSAPADYGGAIPALGVVFAVRDGTAEYTTAAPLALTGTGGSRSFPSTQTFRLVGGSLDYNAGALGSGSDSIGNTTTTNTSSTAGTFTDLGDGSARLTTPLTAVFTGTLAGNPVTYNLVGSLQGLSPFPTVDLNGSAVGFDTAVNFAPGSAAVPLAPGLETRRLPAGNLASATVVLSPRPDGNAESLSVTLGTSGLTASAYDPATGTLTISGSAPLATYQTVLRTVAYRDTAATPTTGARTVNFTIDDGTVASLAHTATVTVAAAAPRVTGVQFNPGVAQHSSVKTVAVTFSAVVTFAGPVANAFQLSRIGGGAVGAFTATAATVGGVTVVTLTNFTGAETSGATTANSLADGRYQVTVVAAQVTAGGVQLDGDGNGTGGDNYVIAGTTTNGLFRYYGDFDGNGVVDGTDLVAYVPTLFNPANYAAQFDFNGDGVVDGTDLVEFVQNLFVPLP